MFSFVKNSLRLKIILLLVVILAASFGILSAIIVNVQNTFLVNMMEQVDTKLVNTGKAMQVQFAELELNLKNVLMDMRIEAAGTLADLTADALAGEEEQVKQGMESLLKNNAEAVANLLVSVTAKPIMEGNYQELVKYSESVAEADEIIYALFLDKEGKFLPGHINIFDYRILNYIENGKGETDMQKVLDASKKDPGVLIYEEKMAYYGTDLGTLHVCISKASVEKEVEKLSERFAALQKVNTGTIKEVMKTQSTAVIDRLSFSLDTVNQKNSTAIRETEKMFQDAAAEARTRISKLVALIGGVCCVVIIVLLSISIRFLIVGPIKRIADGLRDVAEGEGDLTKRLSSDRGDEIGQLAHWFDAFMTRLNAIIVDIGKDSQVVTAFSEDVLAVSEKMNDNAADLSGRANTVAASSEEMSSSMNSIAAAGEQASANMTAVAEAAGQMKQTLDEVAGNCSKAKGVADSASGRVETAVGKVSDLGETAKEISQVTEMITDIASQTDLLALNATIEAARAGEAGKGFAVVANEIKSLASQTQDATRQIKERIEGIQTSTDETASEVSRVSSVISELNEIVSAIAAAMDQQAAITSEVADNIDQASSGINEVSENVAQSSQAASEIASEISEVNSVAGEMADRSTQMKKSSEELAGLSSKLQDMISVFRVADETGDGKEPETPADDQDRPDASGEASAFESEGAEQQPGVSEPKPEGEEPQPETEALKPESAEPESQPEAPESDADLENDDSSPERGQG